MVHQTHLEAGRDMQMQREVHKVRRSKTQREESHRQMYRVTQRERDTNRGAHRKEHTMEGRV
jgi:hypothetical protein